MTMNRTDAVRLLHERHPQAIDAPERPVDLELLHLEFFWFQTHVCDVIDERSRRAARRCFATVERALLEGDAEVRAAVLDHFFAPDLLFHPDLAWARTCMSTRLARICDGVLARLPGRRYSP